MFWIGTSGYSYPEWKGSFYPDDLSAAKMLSYYAARLTTVEINNTFYRMPSDKMLTNWANGTPESFTFRHFLRDRHSPHELITVVPRHVSRDCLSNTWFERP